LTTAVPITALAGRVGGTGSKAMTRQTQTDQIRRGQRLRLRDGSCLDAAKTRSGALEKKGNTYGSGDGTGNETPLQDRNEYGEPSEK
jgi:hypothetical protein